MADYDQWGSPEEIGEIEKVEAADPFPTSTGDCAMPTPAPTTTDLILSPHSSVSFDFTAKDEDESEERMSRRNSSHSVALQALCLPPDLAMIAPCPIGSPTLDLRIPAFSEFSDRPNRRFLVSHFCSVLSHLIVFREESGNPFQQLVLPLSHGSTPVMNAIYALASAHLEHRGVDTGEKSVFFHNEAIQGLAQLIEKGGKVNHKNELLAAIMLLVYYEVVSTSGKVAFLPAMLTGEPSWCREGARIL